MEFKISASDCGIINVQENLEILAPFFAPPKSKANIAFALH